MYFPPSSLPQPLTTLLNHDNICGGIGTYSTLPFSLNLNIKVIFVAQTDILPARGNGEIMQLSMLQPLCLHMASLTTNLRSQLRRSCRQVLAVFTSVPSMWFGMMLAAVNHRLDPELTANSHCVHVETR